MKRVVLLGFSLVILIGCSNGEGTRDAKPSTTAGKHFDSSGIIMSVDATKQSDASLFLDNLGKPMTLPDNGGQFELTAYCLPDIALPSGQIVASDGFIMEGGPFSRQVKPGAYPLFLAIAKFSNDKRVAFAMLRFSDAPVSRWEMAVTKGQDPDKLQKDEIFGYGVDSGTGCFCDFEAQRVLVDAFDPDGSFFNDVIGKMSTCEWVHIKTPKGSAALFSSGFGDGSYASYFGLDEAGNAAVLVTDFGVLDWPRRPSK